VDKTTILVNLPSCFSQNHNYLIWYQAATWIFIKNGQWNFGISVFEFRK